MRTLPCAHAFSRFALFPCPSTSSSSCLVAASCRYRSAWHACFITLRRVYVHLELPPRLLLMCCCEQILIPQPASAPACHAQTHSPLPAVFHPGCPGGLRLLDRLPLPFSAATPHRTARFPHTTHQLSASRQPCYMFLHSPHAPPATPQYNLHPKLPPPPLMWFAAATSWPHGAQPHMRAQIHLILSFSPH